MGLDPVGIWQERVRQKPTPVDLVDSLLPAEPSISILGGPSGIGKTNLALQLAFSVATGVDFLGFPTKQATVGYVCFEGNESKMADRLDKISAQFPPVGDNLHFDMWPPVRLEGNEMHFQERFGGMGLVVLDPLKYLVKGDYIKPVDASRFLLYLHVLMEAIQAPILLCHHVRKKDDRYLVSPDDMFQLKGAGDYVDAATTVILLERKRQGRTGGRFAGREVDAFTIHFPKTRNAVAEIEPIHVRFDRSRLLFHLREFNPDID